MDILSVSGSWTEHAPKCKDTMAGHSSSDNATDHMPSLFEGKGNASSCRSLGAERIATLGIRKVATPGIRKVATLGLRIPGMHAHKPNLVAEK